MRLKDRTAIITGASSGLGFAFARRFLEEGARVAIADIRGADKTAEEISSFGDCFGVEVDVADEASTERMVEAVLARYGRIDILINNAAISSTLELKPFEEWSMAEWHRILDINTIGTMLCCKAVSAHMRGNGAGRIINMASGTAIKGVPMLMPYVASKGAIISMTRALSKEFGDDNVLVNAISPGYTVTEAMLRNTPFHESTQAGAVATRSLKRDATPEDIVGAAVFLASDDSAFITGQILAVDGGSVYH